MRRRSIYLALGITLASIAVVVAVLSWRSSRAQECLHQAQALLDVPFSEAPQLHEIAASEALAQIECAEKWGQNDTDLLRRYAEALSHFVRGDLVFAKEALQAAQRRWGWDSRFGVLAAAIARSNQNLEEAQHLVERVLAEEPQHPRALLLFADIALDRHDGHAASLALSQLAEQVSGVAIVHNRQGLAFEYSGEMRLSEEAYRRALEFDETLFSAWVNWGRILRQKGHREEARRAFSRATQEAPGDADAWMGLALVELDAGELQSAAIHFARVRELTPYDVAGLVGLADVALRQGNILEALDGYRQIVREVPHDGAMWVKLGNGLVHAGQYEEAERAFQHAIEHAPQLAAGHNGLGAALMYQGNAFEAKSAFQRAASLDPQDPHPWMNLGLLYERSGDENEAKSFWNQVLQRDPHSRIAREHLAALK